MLETIKEEILNFKTGSSTCSDFMKETRKVQNTLAMSLSDVNEVGYVSFKGENKIYVRYDVSPYVSGHFNEDGLMIGDLNHCDTLTIEKDSWLYLFKYSLINVDDL